MPNTTSAKKALRSSLRKQQNNNFWKSKIKIALKSLKNKLETKNAGIAILNKELTALQKVLDKASKNNVIHKNKANRLKSRYAKKITAQSQSNIPTDNPEVVKPAKSKAGSNAKSKSKSKSTK